MHIDRLVFSSLLLLAMTLMLCMPVIPLHGIYEPEVAVTNVDLVIHSGLGCFYNSNVSHLVVFDIWTNTPQKVTVFVALYDMSSDTPTLINGKTVELELKEGVNRFMEWISVCITKFTPVRALVKIVKWECDTDPRNNALMSEQRVLRPFADFQVFALWRPKETKQSWTLLPGDTIEIDVGGVIPINTTVIPLKLEYYVKAKNLTLNTFTDIVRNVEWIRVSSPGTVWRNFTVVVPWTSKLVVGASIHHELDDDGLNNNVSITIPIDPNIVLTVVRYPSLAVEGDVVSVVVHLKSNVEAEEDASAWINVEDISTNTLIKHIDVMLEPEKDVELVFTAPKNPPGNTVAIHTLRISVVGYDSYQEDSEQIITLTVLSRQSNIELQTQLMFMALIVALLAIVMALISLVLVLRRHR